MGKGAVTLIAFGLLIVPLIASQSVQLTDIPTCPPSVDDAKNYPENMIRPKYPKDDLRKGVPGIVELRAVVTPEGRTGDLAVLNGDPEFAQAALAAIRKWRFHPELKQGQPVETTYKIHVRFNPMLREANSDVAVESPPPEPPPTSTFPKSRREGLGTEVHRMSEPGMVAPRELYSPEPEFSEKASIEKQQGNVDIDLVVGADGLPRELQIACSSATDLNDNALAAVKQWKFAPATKDGVPVPVEIVVEVSFKLYDH
ncbi:MAG: energy transducer TonB [Candidatus Sulfotelmatobacter sp.]